MENLGIKEEGKDPQTLFIEILTRLQHIDKKPCLLIIDNADMSLGQWYDYLPHQPQWHILVTSREQIERFDKKNLDFLSEDEAVELFLSHYTRGEIDAQEVREIVSELDLHTLAIEILAKTAQLQRISPNELSNAIEKDLQSNVYVQHKGDKIEAITSYLCSIFALSHLDKDELLVLKQFSCLPPEFQRYDLLQELVDPPSDSNDATLPAIFDALQKKGWLLYHSKSDSYKMHRIIVEVIRKQAPINLSDIKGLIEKVTVKLSIDQTKDNPVDKFPWIPYGQTLLSLIPSGDIEVLPKLQNNLALVLQDLGDYEGAKVLLEKAMISAEKNFGENHPTTAVSYSNLALVLQDLGDYEGAKVLLEKAMISDEKNFGENHPTTAVSYSNLALVLKDLGDYEGAKVLLEKAMISDEKNFGENHPTTAVRYSNLALVLQDLGDYEGAKVLLEKAMISDEKNFGENHPTTAVRYSNLALVLKDLGDYEGAKVLLEKAMISAEKNFGENHPTTAVRYSNLALVLQDLGDYEGAKVLLEKAMISDEKNFGENHPTTAVRYSNLALVLKGLGDYEGALKLSEKSVSIFISSLPNGHPNIRTVCRIRDAIKDKLISGNEQ